jgi:hypothetical protein
MVPPGFFRLFAAAMIDGDEEDGVALVKVITLY